MWVSHGGLQGGCAEDLLGGYYRGCRKGCCRQGFKGYCRARRGCCRALCTGMSHGVLRGGIWGTLLAVSHGEAELFVKVVLQGSVPKLLVFNTRTRIIRAFEEKCSYNARIFVILSYFLLYRAPSTRCELHESVQSYGNNSAM